MGFVHNKKNMEYHYNASLLIKKISPITTVSPEKETKHITAGRH